MRVANFYGGPERQIHRHALAARPDISLVVATFAEERGMPAWLDRLASDGIETHVFPVAGAYDPRAVVLLRRYLRRHLVDIVCTHDYRSSLIGALAVRGTRSRWIAFSRGATRDDLKVRAFQAAEALAIRLAWRIVAVSRAQAAKLRRHGIPARRIVTVPNAVDVSDLRQSPAVNLRERFGFSPETVVGMSAGRFSPEKGQRCLVDALAHALREIPELRFVLFGDGPDLEPVRAMVRDLGIEGRVVCPGFAADVVACMKGADVVVNPSLSEGLPNVVLEAMAVGAAVVATAVGGVPELIVDGETGYLVPSGDPRALAGALTRAVRDRSASGALAVRGREHVTRRFSFASQNRLLGALYRAGLRGRPRCPASCR